jgi:hypothetical protein
VRVLGRCTECSRFRYVRVGSGSYVRGALAGVCEGICQECEEKDAARPRVHSQRRARGGSRVSDGR